MGEDSKDKQRAAPAAAAGFSEQIDAGLLMGGEHAEAAMESLDGLIKLARQRQQWVVVERVWRVAKLHPWITESCVDWDRDRKATIAQWEEGSTLVDRDKLAEHLGGLTLRPEEDPVRKRHEDFLDDLASLREQSPDDAEAERQARLARLRVTDDLDLFDWSALDWGQENWVSRPVPLGTREAIARALLTGESLAAWEAAGLGQEVAAATPARIPGARDGEPSVEETAPKRTRAGFGRL